MDKVHRRIEILSLIKVIRDSFPNAVEVYTKGSCFQFALILSTVFRDGEIYYNEDHAIFENQGYFYDITGEVSGEGYMNVKDYPPYKINEFFKLKYQK